MAGSGYNGVLTASGYGSIPIRVKTIEYGLNIVGSPDASSTFKYFYTRQRQVDSFNVTVIFDSTAEREAFFTWFREYALQAIAPSSVGPVRVQVPVRNFDMTATLVNGVQKVNAPTDVLWENTLVFQGATFNTGYTAASTFSAPANSVSSQYFYPQSTDLNASSVPAPTPLVYYTSIAIQDAINRITGYETAQLPSQIPPGHINPVAH